MKKQQGLTLIEIMISLALGIFIIAATLQVYIGTIKSSSDTIKSARLNHDLAMAMSLMSNDIKRAGYWGGAIIGAANLLNNSFTRATTDIKIFNLASPTTALTAAAGDCILYSYDANSSGALTPTILTDDVDANEYYGFRLRTVTNDNNIDVGTIEMRRSGTTTADCSNGVWESIIDENMINITSVQFSFAPLGTLTATSRCLNASIPTTSTAPTNPTDALLCNPAPTSTQRVVQKRIVNIQLTGQLIGADNAEVTKTLNNTVKVRNNRVYQQP